MRDLHFHDLRRTYATRLINEGVSLPIVAKLLGQSAAYVTERYAHVNDAAARKAVAALDVAMQPQEMAEAR